MSEKPKNPSAFPVSEDIWQYTSRSGMTLLDYIASENFDVARSLVNELSSEQVKSKLGEKYNGDVDQKIELSAMVAYQIASAMLKEREAHL